MPALHAVRCLHVHLPTPRTAAWARAGFRPAAVALVARRCAPQPGRAAPSPPPAVTVATVELQNVAPTTRQIGRVQAIQSVAIAARVQAFVDKINFQEGGKVKAGQLLFELQRAPYQAAVDAAQGALQKAQATLRNAQFIYERDSKLARGVVVSQQQLDSDIANRDGDAADVLSARANLETAAINLSYTQVTSPIDGRIGIATYTQGNLVGPSSSPLATVVQIDPIRVVFSVADSAVVEALQRTQKTRVQLSSSVSLGLELSDGRQYPQKGRIEFIDNKVDPTTGTVAVWGLFANPQDLLIPGGFATVEVSQAKPQEALLVPVQSVQNDKSGDFALVVGADNKVTQQKVTTSRQLGQNWIVSAGLKPGDRVIVEGMQKVKAGETVNPVAQPAQTVAAAAPVAASGAGH